MKCIILCGGKGMRMGGLTSEIPKPLVDIKGESLIIHIMKLYHKYGINEFILPLGYKGEVIKEYFVNLSWKKNDFHLSMENNTISIYGHKYDFSIYFIDTGIASQTGYRINQCKALVGNERFLLTYGDGLSNVNIHKLISFHEEKNRIVTVTGINKKSQFGSLRINNGVATSFEEKGYSREIINGGFFCCEPQVFDYLEQSEQCVFESEPMTELVENNQLAVYFHDGFWVSIDTQKDLFDVNEMQENLWEK
ncbi:sugar phosphate nucleotidyltransferase [Providencia rettgeri]